jgi:hypothetical protein
MAHTACLVVSVNSASGRNKNIGSYGGHIDPALLPCFGRMLINPACLFCFVNVPANKAVAETDFCKLKHSSLL